VPKAPLPYDDREVQMIARAARHPDRAERRRRGASLVREARVNDNDTHWHFDKRVPLALIFAILVQTGAALWWAAGVNARVEQLERQVISSAPTIERIVRLETKMDAIFSQLADITLIVQRVRRGR